MPVNLLYCEGGPKSPDLRVLLAILAGVCTISPLGSKYGLGEKVRFSRGIIANSVIAGLRDRDFDQDDAAPTGNLRPWQVEGGATWLGWFWERTEIENYLLDSVVVQRSLGLEAPETEAYRAALQMSAQAIADYTAARTALSLSRVRPPPLDNCWGSRRGEDRHKFPDQRQERDCRDNISDIVSQHSNLHLIREQDVLERFDALLPTCRLGGRRFQHFMTFFAGKDLLFGMETALANFGFASPFIFRESVLKGIEKSSEDVWTWLPEWQHLRDLVSSIASNDGP